MSLQTQVRLIPARDVRHLIGDISEMTLWRWLNESAYQSLNFPKPIKINTRNYWDNLQISKWISNQIDQTSTNLGEMRNESKSEG